MTGVTGENGGEVGESLAVWTGSCMGSATAGVWKAEVDMPAIDAGKIRMATIGSKTPEYSAGKFYIWKDGSLSSITVLLGWLT